MGEDRFPPFLGSAAIQGLLGIGVGGEGNYIHTFKILVSAQGKRTKSYGFACKSKLFGTIVIENNCDRE